MFVRLGLTNSIRQLGRNMLVLVAMVLSAISLTSALSFGQSNAKESYHYYRQLLGGEILVSPVRWTGRLPTDITADTVLEPVRLQRTGLSWLEAYYPELYRDGFLATAGSEISQSVPEGMLEQLIAEPGISGYNVQYQFPASLTNGSSTTEKYINVTILPIRDQAPLTFLKSEQAIATLPDTLPDLPSEQPFALINSYLKVSDSVIKRIASTIPDSRVVYEGEEVMPTPEQIYNRKSRWALPMAIEEMELPGQGEIARLRIPELRSVAGGEYLPDYSEVFVVDVPTFSQVAVPTRIGTFISQGGLVIKETAYLHGGYVWLPQELWQRLWHRASGGASPVMSNLVLQVENMDDMEQIVEVLQAKYQQFTFVSVAQFASRVEKGLIIDRFYRIPKRLARPEEVQLGVPLNVGKIMGVLFYLVAGMLIASRILTGAAARRLEIGVLKALGARRRDIAAMVLTESLLVTVLGTSIGFVLVRLGGVMKEIGNNLPLTTVLSRTLGEYGTVVGTASLVSLLFTLLPAWRMSNLTVMGVLRGE